MSRTPAPLPDPLGRRPFSVGAADAAGVGRGRLRRNDLAAPHVGVRANRLPVTLEERVNGYLPILATGEFFSHGTAAQLHGLWLPRELEEETVLDVSVVPPQRAPRNAGVRGHHLVDRPGLVRTLAGRPVADVVETWCQLARVLDLPDLVAAGDAVLQAGRPRPDLVRARMLIAAADVDRPFARRLARAAALIRPGVRSPQETRLRLLLTRAGLPEPEVNGRIVDGSGRFVAESDPVFRRERVLVEYEGDGHRELRQFRKDIHRYERLQELGWRVIRVTADDLRLRPRELAERIRRALALAHG